MHRLLVADGDPAQVFRRIFRPPHDVRDDRDHQFLALPIHALAGEQATQDRNAAQPRDASLGLGVLVLGEARQKLHGAIRHADIVRNFALADDRLVDAAQVDLAGYARDIQVNVE